MNDWIITGARIVTPKGVIEDGTVTVRGGRIADVRGGDRFRADSEATPAASVQAVDARGRWLLPGLVDLHNDSLEKEIEPRPGAVFPHTVALIALENRMVSHGITTIFHALAFMDGRDGLPRGAELETTILELTRLSRLGVIRHLFHARYELAENHYAGLLRQVVDRGLVQLVSFMDHSPGQGQFRKLETLLRFYTGEYELSKEEIMARVESRAAHSRSAGVLDTLDGLVAAARAAGLPAASHDDDTPEKVRAMRDRGIGISEFPVELAAARAAAEAGQVVIVGAPNVLLGGSNSGNMSARAAIEAGYATVMCSDYYSPAMIHAAFTLARQGVLPLPEAVNTVSLNPARAVALDQETGPIEPGKWADLILVGEAEGLPVVTAVWVEGRKVYEKCDGGHPGGRPLHLEPGAPQEKGAVGVG